MTGQLPGGPVAAAGQGMATGLPGGLPGRRVIAVLLLAAGTLDLARCGVAVVAIRVRREDLAGVNPMATPSN
jgi:hypothetical protein